MTKYKPLSFKFFGWLFVITVTFLASLWSSKDVYGQNEALLHDLIIRNGTIYDGTGRPGLKADLAVDGDRIVSIGNLAHHSAKKTIDAAGLAVTPGFINILSWANESLLVDGRGMSDLLQGVTLEVMGEGVSMGPLNEEMKRHRITRQTHLNYNLDWTTLGEYLQKLESKGVSPNVASFVGATSLRIHEIGYENRKPTTEEMLRMRELVAQAMKEGALGVSSSLIYPPAFFASTEELVQLAKVASEFGGMYISHVRSEANQLLEAIGELITISREANVRAQIYHLKMGGQHNWGKYDDVIKMIMTAREKGLQITADVYPYPAAATGILASFPPWSQEGGFDALVKRLKDPSMRAVIRADMTQDNDDWEHNLLHAGADGILMVGFRTEALRNQLTGKTLGEIARERAKDPIDVAMDLIVEDGSDIHCIYFLMSEENVAKIVALPWTSFNSDEAAPAIEEPFTNRMPHPRAYGTFARVLAKYVRDEKRLPLSEAIRKLTSFPADTLRIQSRGKITQGYFADIAIFDPDKIQDHATFTKPHQYATGMVHVFVNGIQVVENGIHTGATPGRVVRGPGWVSDYKYR